MSGVRERFLRLLAEQVAVDDPATIGDASVLQEDLVMDSLDAVELVLACEEEFEIEIPDSAWLDGKVETVGQAVAVIERCVGGRA